MTTTATPREIDEALAAEHHVLDSAMRSAAWSDQTAQYAKGDRRQGATGAQAWRTTAAQAWERVTAALAAGQDDYVSMIGKRLSELVAQRDERQAAVDEILGRIDTLETRYTGWTRFFVVTSSAGHVHSSMHCSTCRATTTYGWLPELSGQTEAQAVAQLGPALCSVCFPSAPVAHTGGKITKAKASKLAA